MAKYRKLPVIIEAMQIPRAGYEHRAEGAALEAWLRDNKCEYSISPDAWVSIHTLEGTMRAAYPSWIIRGVRGEFYPCEDEIFRETYEKNE